VAKLNLCGFEQVAVGHGKLEVLAVAANGLYSGDLEQVVVELNSDSFEQAVARLNVGGFEWAMVGLCKLKTPAVVTAMEAESWLGLGQGGVSEQEARVLMAFDGCEMSSMGLHLARAQAWVLLEGLSGSDVHIAYTKQCMRGREWTSPTCLISAVRVPGLLLLGPTSVVRPWLQLQVVYGKRRHV